jgi:hypothetical protein
MTIIQIKINGEETVNKRQRQPFLWHGKFSHKNSESGWDQLDQKAKTVGFGPPTCHLKTNFRAVILNIHTKRQIMYQHNNTHIYTVMQAAVRTLLVHRIV